MANFGIGILDKEIEQKIKEFLPKIDSTEKKIKLESFFYNDLMKYLRELGRLSNKMINDEQVDLRIFNELKEINRNIFEAGEGLTNEFNDSVLSKQTRELFREITGKWFYRSQFFAKSLKKARGYPGDFEMMNIIYDNKIIAEDMIGKYFDKYYLENPYAEAVRNRKNAMVKIIGNFIESTEDKDTLRMFNLACGPCREIKELLSEPLKINKK